jgi:hypothetical protein
LRNFLFVLVNSEHYTYITGIVAYVEVRSGGDNRSMGIKAHLKSLGASVRDKFTNDVRFEFLIEMHDSAGFVFFAICK